MIVLGEAGINRLRTRYEAVRTFRPHWHGEYTYIINTTSGRRDEDWRDPSQYKI